MFFQAEDGIRDAQESRGLGDVYKRQTAYVVGEPTIDEMIDDEDNSVMMRKMIRINMLIE